MTNRYGSVLEMLSSYKDPEIEDLKQRVEEKSSKMTLARALFCLRNALGLTQEELAQKMDQPHSLVEKIEHCDDDQMYIQDLTMYVSAMGYRLSIGIHKEKITDSVKYHAHEIHRIVNHLAEISKGDSKMESDTRKFFSEAMFNIIKIIDAAASRLEDEEVEVSGESLEVFAATTNIPENTEVTSENSSETIQP